MSEQAERENFERYCDEDYKAFAEKAERCGMEAALKLAAQKTAFLQNTIDRYNAGLIKLEAAEVFADGKAEGRAEERARWAGPVRKIRPYLDCTLARVAAHEEYPINNVIEIQLTLFRDALAALLAEGEKG